MDNVHQDDDLSHDKRSKRDREQNIDDALPQRSTAGGHSVRLKRERRSRRKADKDLLASNENYRMLFEGSPLGILLLDADGRFVECNGRFTALLGATKKSHERADLRAFLTDRQVKLAVAAALRGSACPIAGEFTLVASGKRLIVRGEFTPLRSTTETITGIMGFFEDVTDRVRNEDDLRRVAEHYRMLTENMMDVVWILDPDTMRYRYMSPSVIRLRGYAPEEVLTAPFDDALLPDATDYHKARIRQRIRDFISGQENPDRFYINEVEQPCKDGSTVWTEEITRYTRNRETGKIEVLGLSRNIMERKKAEAALRASIERFRTIVDSMDDFIFTIDRKQRCTGVYGRRLHKTRIIPGAILGRKASMLFGAGTSEAHDGAIQRALTGNAVTYEWTGRGVWDGTCLLIELSPIQDPDGGVVGVVGIARDITDRKKAEEERERLIEELQDALKKVKTLSGLLPICSSCKKIRDDKGYWTQIESYITHHSDAMFTHGLCPDCANAFYERYGLTKK